MSLNLDPVLPQAHPRGLPEMTSSEELGCLQATEMPNRSPNFYVAINLFSTGFIKPHSFGKTFSKCTSPIEARFRS